MHRQQHLRHQQNPRTGGVCARPCRSEICSALPDLSRTDVHQTQKRPLLWEEVHCLRKSCTVVHETLQCLHVSCRHKYFIRVARLTICFLTASAIIHRTSASRNTSELRGISNSNCAALGAHLVSLVQTAFLGLASLLFSSPPPLYSHAHTTTFSILNTRSDSFLGVAINEACTLVLLWHAHILTFTIFILHSLSLRQLSKPFTPTDSQSLSLRSAMSSLIFSLATSLSCWPCQQSMWNTHGGC